MRVQHEIGIQLAKTGLHQQIGMDNEQSIPSANQAWLDNLPIYVFPTYFPSNRHFLLTSIDMFDDWVSPKAAVFRGQH